MVKKCNNIKHMRSLSVECESIKRTFERMSTTPEKVIKIKCNDILSQTMLSFL